MNPHYIYIKVDSDFDRAIEIAKYVDAWAVIDAPQTNNRVIRVYRYFAVVYALATNDIHFTKWQQVTK